MRAAFLILITTAVSWLVIGGHNVTIPDQRIHLRNINHPAYLLYGCSAAVIFIELFTAVRRAAGISFNSTWMIFGRTSLFTFCFGNILLYAAHLWDPSAPPDPVRFVAAAAAALTLSVLYGRFREWKGLQSSHPLAKAYRWLFDDSVANFVRWAMKPFLHPPAPIATRPDSSAVT